MKEIIRQISGYLANEEFSKILEVLRSERPEYYLTPGDKREIIETFDEFLALLADKRIVYEDVELQQLAEIKKYLILFELEKSAFNPERLKELIRHKIKEEQPLEDLVGRPFAFSYNNKRDGRLTQVYGDVAIGMYREVLEEMDPSTALKLHQRQILYYDLIPSSEAYTRHALRGLVQLKFGGEKFKQGYIHTQGLMQTGP